MKRKQLRILSRFRKILIISPHSDHLPQELLTIENLPFELIILILEKLGCKDMIASSAVSKKWRAAIINSKKFLETVELNLTEESLNSMNIISRKYQSLKIYHSDPEKVIELSQEFVKSLQKFSVCLKSIDVFNAQVSSIDFFEFLQTCENLESMEAWCMEDPITIQDYQTSKIILKKLKSLTVLSSCWILDRLECKDLKFLHIMGRNPVLKNSWSKEFFFSPKMYINFLNQLESVETLMLWFSDFHCQEELHPRFKWKHLKVFNIPGDFDGSPIDNWKRLVNSAEENSKISFEAVIFNLPAKILNEIAKCKNITTFKFHIDSLPPPEDNQFYENLDDFRYIKTVKFRNPRKMNDARIMKFLRHFPHIETIDVDFNLVEFPVVEENVVFFDKTKKLRIAGLTESFHEIFFFPQTEYLEVDFFHVVHCEMLIEVINLQTKLKHLKLHLQNFATYAEYVFIRICLIGSDIETIEIVDWTTGEIYEGKASKIEQKLIKTGRIEP